MDSFLEKYGDIIKLLIKPFFTVVTLICMGYFTMWLSLNYVKQNEFAEYIEKQMVQDKIQDNTSKERFDVIQSKLETIITQQVSYSEQLKAYNQIMIGFQKQVDGLDDRLKYIERNDRNNKHSNY
jgi:hypothetical protein